MEELFKGLAAAVALGVEASAALLIAVGAVEALYNTARRLAPGLKGVIHKKEIWVRLRRGCYWPSSSSWRPMSSAVRSLPRGATSDSSRRLPRSAPF
jgi:hypothetical protein